jgi:hypothetical protein
MDIATKTLGFLIDELITTSMKCWYGQELLKDPNATDKELADALRLIQATNDRRNRLIRAIDERVGEADSSPTAKTYHTYYLGKQK